MGEEKEEKTSGGEKKMEEEEKKKPNKEEEKPKKEDGGEAKNPAEKESKDSKEMSPPPPPPPQDIVLRVYMHCEGCARKVRRCLKGFDGVEDVTTDCRTSKVVVKGEKADPLKVVERVQRKSHRQVELISPIPKPPPAEEEKKPGAEEKPKPQDKKEEPQVITVVLKVYMHCEACAMEIKKRILRMKGVESAEPDLKTSEVAVKGVFDPPKLVDYVYKRTGKKAVIVKQEPEKKKEDEEGDKGKAKEPSKDEGEKKKGEEEGGKDKKEQEGDNKTKEKKEGEGEGDDAAMETTTVVELKRSEYQYYPQRNPPLEMMYYAYPPQIFSDENPNACTVM